LDIDKAKFVTALYSALFGTFEADTFMTKKEGQVVSVIIPFDKRGLRFFPYYLFQLFLIISYFNNSLTE
jgi:hypothetical protein